MSRPLYRLLLSRLPHRSPSPSLCALLTRTGRGLLPLVTLATLITLTAPLPAGADELAAARKRWAESPHGPMLERILPPGYTPEMLPERGSRGAQLTLKYCVQCHNLANPAMHDAQKWPRIYDRMLQRMEGRGNMGKLMHEMMAGVQAPGAADSDVLIAYLRKHAQKPIDARKVPALNTPAAEPFRLACQQCHVLPDPQRYTAKEWPAVVARMEHNMEWMNRVVGSRPVKGEPQLRVAEINAFLARHAKAP